MPDIGHSRPDHPSTPGTAVNRPPRLSRRSLLAVGGSGVFAALTGCTHNPREPRAPRPTGWARRKFFPVTQGAHTLRIRAVGGTADPDGVAVFNGTEQLIIYDCSRSGYGTTSWGPATPIGQGLPDLHPDLVVYNLFANDNQDYVPNGPISQAQTLINVSANLDYYKTFPTEPTVVFWIANKHRGSWVRTDAVRDHVRANHPRVLYIFTPDTVMTEANGMISSDGTHPTSAGHAATAAGIDAALAARVAAEDPLVNTWQHAVTRAKGGGRPIRILFIGDSQTAGNGATDRVDRMPESLATKIRARHQLSGSSYYQPAGRFAVGGASWELADLSGTGPDWAISDLTLGDNGSRLANGQYRDIAFTGNGVEVVWANHAISGAGDIELFLDGNHLARLDANGDKRTRSFAEIMEASHPTGWWRLRESGPPYANAVGGRPSMSSDGTPGSAASLVGEAADRAFRRQGGCSLTQGPSQALPWSWHVLTTNLNAAQSHGVIWVSRVGNLQIGGSEVHINTGVDHMHTPTVNIGDPAALHQFVVTATSGGAILYVDGVERARSTVSHNLAPRGQSWLIFSGIGSDGPVCDEPAIWNRELTEAEVSEMWAAVAPVGTRHSQVVDDTA